MKRKKKRKEGWEERGKKGKRKKGNIRIGFVST